MDDSLQQVTIFIYYLFICSVYGNLSLLTSFPFEHLYSTFEIVDIDQALLSYLTQDFIFFYAVPICYQLCLCVTSILSFCPPSCQAKWLVDSGLVPLRLLHERCEVTFDSHLNIGIGHGFLIVAFLPLFEIFFTSNYNALPMQEEFLWEAEMIKIKAQELKSKEVSKY